MSNFSGNDEHVGDLLSGFVDEELTQQDSQRVQVHIDACTNCATELAQIRAVRERLGVARLSNLNQDTWRETMDDMAVNTSRGIGWLLLIGGLLAAAGFGVVQILTEFSSWSFLEKLMVVGIYGGALFIFVSVLRQRLIERKKDRYKDVEI